MDLGERSVYCVQDGIDAVYREVERRGHRIWHDTDLTVYIIVKRGRQHTQRLEHDTRPGPYDRLDPPTIGATATGGALLQCVCTSCGTHASPAGVRCLNLAPPGSAANSSGWRCSPCGGAGSTRPQLCRCDCLGCATEAPTPEVFEIHA